MTIDARHYKKCLAKEYVSAVSLTKHQKICKKGGRELSLKIHPVRLAARRQRELMFLPKYIETTELEWYDEEDVDTTGLQEPPRSKVVGGTPVLPVEERSPIWESLE